jgi:mannose-6-phosphate isomerase-like protein (cupin superfamily)
MRAGQEIGNRKTGETLTMLVSECDNGGAKQLYRVRLPGWRPSPPLHYHLDFTETFSVLEGRLDLFVGPERKHFVLEPNESLTVSIGQLHTFANLRQETSTITVETIPAGGVVKAFNLAYGVANDGGAAKDGLPKNLLVRLMFIRISQGFLPTIPLFLQSTILSAAAVVSQLTGTQSRLAHYFEDC